MKADSNRSSAKKIYYKIGFALIWIVIWEVLSLLVGSDLILPGPVRTLQSLVELMGTGAFWLNAAWTMARVIIGIAVSFAAGSACAVLASRNKAFREFLSLPVSYFKSIPVMAIIIYVILVVKSDFVAIVVCFFMCFPISYTNMLHGLMNVSKEYDELGTVLGMDRHRKWVLITRPQLTPAVQSSLDLITGMSWKVVVASEVLSIPEFSIGYQMLNSKYYLDTPGLFSYIIVLILLSVLLGRAVSYLSYLDQQRETARLRQELLEPSMGAASDMSGDIKVELADVYKSFDAADGTHKDVLSGFSLSMSAGITSLTGPSGRGKTTVARLVSGLEQPDSGKVTVEPEARAAVLFQEDRLLPWLTVNENMMTAFFNSSTSHELAEKKIKEMAAKLEIDKSLGMYPSELSGGMAHRAALGRALLSGSSLLILDEPFRGLDEGLKERIIERLADSVRYAESGEKRTVMLITHDEALAERLADRVIRM